MVKWQILNAMNQELWAKIQQYDLDEPWSEFGFSTRLANQNYWTKNFTAKAIVEYKKFMYLAATSDMMVSPSETVDVVWHQHLIFTKSYQEFCEVAGKVIQHVPSTHNREDFAKFKQAKERTRNLYKSVFGEQPADIWEYSGMYESLELEKAPIKIRTFILLGILAFVGLITPAYFLLRPLYITLNNPGFMIGLIVLSLAVVIGLENYNRSYLAAVIRGVKPSSFLHHLAPLELVYLKTQDLANVVHGVVNPMIAANAVVVHGDETLSGNPEGLCETLEAYQVLTTLEQTGRRAYPPLVGILMRTPLIYNTSNCMDAFNKYFNKSKKFGWLFYLNFGLFSVLLMASLVRLLTGLLRGKPVDLIVIFTVLLTALIIWFLNRLTKEACTKVVPDMYLHRAHPTQNTEQGAQAWQWTYFASGAVVLSPLFIPLVNRFESPPSGGGDGGGDSSSSSDSSCGSSCSSCGGCGGD
jgi:hypothetical protein